MGETTGDEPVVQEEVQEIEQPDGSVVVVVRKRTIKTIVKEDSVTSATSRTSSSSHRMETGCIENGTTSAGTVALKQQGTVAVKQPGTVATRPAGNMAPFQEADNQIPHGSNDDQYEFGGADDDKGYDDAGSGPSRVLIRAQAAAKSGTMEQIATTEGPEEEEVEEIVQPDGSILRITKKSRNVTTTVTREDMAQEKSVIQRTVIPGGGDDDDSPIREFPPDSVPKLMDASGVMVEGNGSTMSRPGDTSNPKDGPEVQRQYLVDEHGNVVDVVQIKGQVEVEDMKGLAKVQGTKYAPPTKEVTEEVKNPDGSITRLTKRVEGITATMSGAALLKPPKEVRDRSPAGGQEESDDLRPDEDGPVIEEIDSDTPGDEGPTIEEVE